MKLLMLCLLLGSVSVAFADSKVPRLVFSPFANEDVATALTRPIAEYFPNENPLPENESVAVTVEEMRLIMTTGESAEQFAAAKKLLERGDQKTILRLVYSLKQGNVAAEEMLRDFPLAATPYLMEDVAHGSLDYYGSYRFGDAVTRDGRVREAAVELVASISYRAPEITGETLECLKAIARGGYANRIQGLSDESRYLVQWWLLDEDAFKAGKWGETQPLPQDITYPDPRKDTLFPRDESWSPEKQPPFGSPLWELPESFEAWSERIVDPKRRNLDFVALSWDGKKVVEHPATSLPTTHGSSKPIPRLKARPIPGRGAFSRRVCRSSARRATR